MNKYILIASNGKGAGKSTFSTSLVNAFLKSNTSVLSVNFADSIREDAFTIISKHSGVDIKLLNYNYNIIKDCNFKYNHELDATFQLRTFLNRYSLFLSDFFPGPVWAKSYLDSVLSKTNNSYIITDDLRRHEELNYLIDKVGRENILLVYLKKDNLKLPSDTSFENLLDPKDFDLVLEFNSDWSNQNEVLKNCLNKVNEYFIK